MRGWLIFKHAVLMLWGNKAVLVQLAAMPLVIATVLVTLFISSVSDLQLMQEMLFPGAPWAQQPELMPEDFGVFFTGLIGFVNAMAPRNVLALFVVAVPLGVILFLLFYRLSVILPASAIGKPITLRQAWTATEGAFFAIFVLVVVGGLFQMCVQFLGGFLIATPMLGFAVNLLMSFALGMINASILTTLYGHYVQGRDL